MLTLHSVEMETLVRGVRPLPLRQTRLFPAGVAKFAMRQPRFHFSATCRKGIQRWR